MDIPETPFSVMTRSGLNSRIFSTIARTCSSSISCILAQSASLEISMFVCDSPFLYSSVQSRSTMRGLMIRRRILG